MENVNTTNTDKKQPTPPVPQNTKTAPTTPPSKPVTSKTAPNPSDTVRKASSDKSKSEVNDNAKPDAEKTTAPGKTEKPDAADKKATVPEKTTQEDKPPKTEKDEKSTAAQKAATEKPEKQPKAPKQEKVTSTTDKKETVSKTADKPKQTESDKAEPPVPTPEPEQPVMPKEAPRPNGTEQIVYLKLDELKPFKNHPFGIRDDFEMQSLTESVKDKGVHSPALVRPIKGGYEIIAGHRRQKASERAGFSEMPCIIREMSDDDAILAMTDDNLRQRTEILPSEKAHSLKMQFEAIKHQGGRFKGVASGDVGKRSIELVGERNGINSKQVQRFIRLTQLEPDLIKAVDEKKIGFTSAVEFSFINRKNQNLIAVSIEGQQSSPSLSQAQRLRKLDQEGKLNGDIIDGILCEEKKEADKVIISSEELNKYFGKEQTPRQMKDQIIKLLDDWSSKEKAHNAPGKDTPDRSK